MRQSQQLGLHPGDHYRTSQHCPGSLAILGENRERERKREKKGRAFSLLTSLSLTTDMSKGMWPV